MVEALQRRQVDLIVSQELSQNSPSQTLSLRMLAPLANPIARPSSLLETVGCRCLLGSSLTTLLLRLCTGGSPEAVSLSIILPKDPKDAIL